MLEKNPFTAAIHRILILDAEVFSAIATSLCTSLGALCIATLFSFLLALYLTLSTKKRAITMVCHTLLDTFLSLPTVLLGLLGYIMFSQQGMLASFSLLYTQLGMSIILAILAFPLLTSLLITGLADKESHIIHTALTLGASYRQAVCTFLWEKRRHIVMAYITTFTRLLSEVGIAMMIGGNIKYHTRTMTTAIALETGKGNFSLGIALGIILLIISSCLTLSIRSIQYKK